MSLTLVIGNKNYSSWSMRPWVLLRQFDIPFDEVLLKFHSAEWSGRIGQLSPTNLVPVLWDGPPGDATATCVWDTLAISEFLADRFPDQAIWPRAIKARARARSICAEMHSGFRALRGAMPMNIRSQHSGKGRNPEALRDIVRIETIWHQVRAEFAGSGDFLFGDFSAADAMFAPVVMRFNTYHPPLAANTLAYCERVTKNSAVAKWIVDAKRETEFVVEDEPYCPVPGQ